ncbi:dTDP-4-dehydrorhamnose 3,5-epimerase family protein [Helicobacter sp. 23-1045]
MEIIATSFHNLFILKPSIFSDLRGEFIKPFSVEIFSENNLECDFVEAFYSTSKKGVLRGMHFQLPPKEHTKLVFVSSGKILDVVVDLRAESASFGRVFSVILDGTNALYIPKGFAHGFLSLADDSKVHYMQTTCYDKTCDSGILFSSINFDWECEAKKYNIDDFIISPRDRSFESAESFYKKGIF